MSAEPSVPTSFFVMAFTSKGPAVQPARRQASARPLPNEVASVVGFLVGAKLYYVILMRDWSLVFTRSGFVYWGGLVGGILAAWIVIRQKKIPSLRVADVAGPGIAAGYAVGRTGCWAVGDDYGRPWSSALAVAFPEGSPPSTAGVMSSQLGIDFPPGTDPHMVVAVHPTQLYQTAMGLVMFAVLWRLRDHKHAQGWLFGARTAWLQALNAL